MFVKCIYKKSDFHDRKVLLNDTFDTLVYRLRFNKNDCVKDSSVSLMKNDWWIIIINND